jgi:hypothetical protein
VDLEMVKIMEETQPSMDQAVPFLLVAVKELVTEPVEPEAQ